MQTICKYLFTVSLIICSIDILAMDQKTKYKQFIERAHPNNKEAQLNQAVEELDISWQEAARLAEQNRQLIELLHAINQLTPLRSDSSADMNQLIEDINTKK